MRLSIRTQIVLLVSALLLAAMGIYLTLATELFITDKRETLYGYNAQLARTLAEEVEITLHGTVDKLLYFGAEQAEQAIQPGVTPDRPARSLFADDPDLLGVEVWDKSGATFHSSYTYVFEERLRALHVDPRTLFEARKRSPMNPERVQAAAEGIVLQNASLPPSLALLRLSVISRDGTRVVVADIRPQRLLLSFSHAQQHSEVYLVDARGTVLVHPNQGLVLEHANRAQSPAVKPALETNEPGGVHEFETPEGTRLGAYAGVKAGRMSVIVEIPRDEATRAARDLAWRSVLFAVSVLLVALVFSVFFARRLAEPLLLLQEKMEHVSRGDFGVEVDVPPGNEIGALAEAFNRMSRELGSRERALLEANQQLIQSEKLSALGEMSAGLAHEVKNPMVGICGFSELGAHVDSLEEAREYFSLINADAQRANEILQNLLAFARPERVDMNALDVNETVRGAVRLIAHQVQIGGVKLLTAYDDGLPQIMGSANQLRQVLINLSMNAAQAMDGCLEKVLTLSTSLGPDGRVQIAVKDTGVGMSEETQHKLFRPFFTTKPKGKGTGLGLSVSRTIVQQHKGDIEVTSVLGQGTTFTIVLPPLVASQRGPATSVAPAA